MTSEAISVDILDNISDKTVKEQLLFFSQKEQQSVSDDLMMMNPEEPSTGLLVQIETDSLIISITSVLSR